MKCGRNFCSEQVKKIVVKLRETTKHNPRYIRSNIF